MPALIDGSNGAPETSFSTCQSIRVIVVVVVSLSAVVVGILIEKRVRVSACITYKLRSAKSVAYNLGRALGNYSLALNLLPKINILFEEFSKLTVK